MVQHALAGLTPKEEGAACIDMPFSLSSVHTFHFLQIKVHVRFVPQFNTRSLQLIFSSVSLQSSVTAEEDAIFTPTGWQANSLTQTKWVQSTYPAQH